MSSYTVSVLLFYNIEVVVVKYEALSSVASGEIEVFINIKISIFSFLAEKFSIFYKIKMLKWWILLVALLGFSRS